MKKKPVFYPSIFNDVLAPATQGPSSSNTAGVYRIAAIARALLDGEPKCIKVEMSKKGGFYDTFFGMESDKACLAGVLGEDLIRSDLGQIYKKAEEAGLEYDFFFTDRIEKMPTEMGEFTISSAEETLVLTGISLGGGEMMIRDINGVPCEIKGMHPETVMIPGSDKPRHIPSVYPIETIKDAKPPFSTSDGMLVYARDTGKTLWETALDYECSLTGLNREEIWSIAEQTLDLAYASIEAGYQDDVTFEGITVPMAPLMREKVKTAPQIPMGASAPGALDALALLEYSNGHGVIVCMPTGGAAGIIPATIKRASAALQKTKEDEIKALLAAGLLGVFYYPTHYHGALGCQAEVGVAASMAAGGVTTFLTDDAEAAEHAAVMAIQYLLGQVCDPIAGYPQIPCFIRNSASVSVAMTCANMAVLGLDTAVPLDYMVDAVLRVGEKLREGRINDLGTCGGAFIPNPCSSCGIRRGQE